MHEEKAYQQKLLDEAYERERQREDEVYKLRDSEMDLLDKVKRLEITVANKSSDIESIEKMLSQERARREAENTEIRNMMLQEQKRSQQVVEEAAKYSAQKERFEE